MPHELAQLNIARFRVPAEDPVNADFVNNLDRINAIAEAQPGFVWRLVGSGNNATDVQAFDDPLIITNLSVWTDIQSLFDFVYRDSAHVALMRRRREWFDKVDVHMALWWIDAGHRPTVAEATGRLAHVQQHGPSDFAFTFKTPFDPPSDRNIDNGD